MKTKRRVVAALLALHACAQGANDPSETSAIIGAPAGGAGTTGAAGLAATGSPTDGCSVANASVGGAALHAGALEAIAGPAASCGSSSSCHQPPRGKAQLILQGATDLRTLMVDRPSCEVPTLSLVSSAQGDIGLNSSWLWIKLVAPLDAGNNLIPKPEWGTPGNCEQGSVGTFGFRMPWNSPMSMYLSADGLAKVRNWICAGAPGP